MFARTPALRAAALFVAAGLTAAMLGGIDGLAQSQRADAVYVNAKAAAKPASNVAVASTIARRG